MASDFSRKDSMRKEFGSISEKMESVTDRGVEAFSTGVETATSTAASIGAKVKDAAVTAAEKTRDAATQVAEAVGSTISEKADTISAAVSEGMKTMAGTIRQKSPASGPLRNASATLANTLEAGGQYLQEHGIGGICQDMGNFVRKNPVPALFLGLGLGFLIARATSRH